MKTSGSKGKRSYIRGEVDLCEVCSYDILFFLLYFIMTVLILTSLPPPPDLWHLLHQGIVV